MEPEILPYQDILDSIQDKKINKNESTGYRNERKINNPPENKYTGTNENTTEKLENTKTKIDIKHIAITDKPEIKLSIASDDNKTQLTYYQDPKKVKETARPEVNFAAKTDSKKEKETARPEVNFAVKITKTTTNHVESFKAKASLTSSKKIEKLSSSEKHRNKTETEQNLPTALNQKQTNQPNLIEMPQPIQQEKKKESKIAIQHKLKPDKQEPLIQ